MRIKDKTDPMKTSDKNKIKITILGSGTSTGVPLLACPCKVCRSKNPKNTRTRASIYIETRGKSFLIDTSPDLRAQALREKIFKIDAVLFTHPHSDHVGGLDEIRAYNFIQKTRMQAYGHAWTCTDLHARFPYIFQNPYDEGGGIPLIDLNTFDPDEGDLTIEGVPFTPIKVTHGRNEVIAYRVLDFAYVTDCNLIPPDSMKKLTGLDLLILDCVRLTPHRTHLHLEESLRIISELKPKRAILSHLGHDFDYVEYTKTGKNRKLPKNVTLAYDGMKVTV